MSTSVEPRKKIIVALDVDETDAALRLMEQLQGAATWMKIGLQLYTREGPQVVRLALERGFRVFLDLKFHDIPNTVHGAVGSAASLGVSLTTIHLSGGPAMIAAAAEAARGTQLGVLGVTVLTSMDAAQLRAVGVETQPADQVLRLARAADAAGLHGVVASPLEASTIRSALPKLQIVTPGIRPRGAASGDQRRIAGPADALAAGADLLVVGRPITAAPDPQAAFLAIAAEMGEG